MIEVLGPNMARTIVGDAFDPDFRYELETNEAGMFLVVTNTLDGTATVQKLQEEQEESKDHESIWIEKELPKDRKGMALNVVLGAMLLIVVGIIAFVVWR